MTGEEFKRWREKFDLTQEQLAVALGIAPNTVARWERDERAIPPTPQVLLQFLEQHVSDEIAGILASVDTARSKYYIASRTGTGEREVAEKRLVRALDRAIKALEAWEARMQEKIEQVYVRERVSIPGKNDPAWALISKSRVWDILAGLRKERQVLEPNE